MVMQLVIRNIVIFYDHIKSGNDYIKNQVFNFFCRFLLEGEFSDFEVNVLLKGPVGLIGYLVFYTVVYCFE